MLDQQSSPQTTRLIAPVVEAIQAEEARQAALPPAVTDRERLERMGELDQVGRRVAVTVDLSQLSGDDRSAAERALWAPVGELDDRLSAELMTLLPPEGWFYTSVYGEDAARAAFLIVQHGDAALQRRFVPVLEPLVAEGEVEGTRYALMYDRLALDEGRPQRYGTQMTCRNARWVIDYDNLEDPENVQARRDAVGFLGFTLAQYEAGFARYPPCRSR
jgi:hypothetical protein